MAAGNKVFSFGPFTLDVTARLFSINGKRVALGSRSFDILVVLVERRGELVSKQDLLARVWPNAHVEEHNLKVHVSALRRALGNEARALLINVPGRGYSFVGPVELSDKSARPTDGGSENDTNSSEPSITKRRPGVLDSGVPKASTVKIGIVHSLTGPMAQSEGPIREATLLAVHEINETGGLLGRLIEPLVVDCKSDEACFST